MPKGPRGEKRPGDATGAGIMLNSLCEPASMRSNRRMADASINLLTKLRRALVDGRHRRADRGEPAEAGKRGAYKKREAARLAE